MFKSLIYLAGFGLAVVGEVSAQSSLPTPVNAVFTDTNGVEIWTTRDGSIGLSPAADWGFSFKGQIANACLMYASGFMIGGKDPQGNLRLLSVRYDTEFQAGEIINSGVDPYALSASNPDADSNGIFVLPGDELTWPNEAPRDALNNPLRLSDEDTWSVFNDLDTTKYGDHTLPPVKPIGLEIQRSTFQFSASPLRNAVIVRLLIINKSNVNYDSVYAALWCDTNVGQNGYDDLTGVDSLLGVLFNYSTTDPYAWCGGFQWLQGPLEEAIGQDADVVTLTPAGFVVHTVDDKMLMPSVSAFRYPNATGFKPNRSIFGVMTGLDFNGATKANGPFDLWYTIPANARGMLATGPLHLAAGDSQEIYYALSGASGTDHSDAVQNFLTQAVEIKTVFENGLVVSIPEPDVRRPGGLVLHPNVPNPFNPSTLIRFDVPSDGSVALKVYNLLGQELVTLFDGILPAGAHQVSWNGQDRHGHAAASGVYFYRLTSGNLSVSRKMILMR